MNKSTQVVPREKYQEWGQFVSRGESARGRRRRMLTTALVTGERLLEIGCAEGWMTRELRGPGRLVVSGDIASSYLIRVRENDPSACLVNLDAQVLPFAPASFDCIVCTEVLEHVIAPFQVLQSINRVLEPGGLLVLSVPNSMTPGRCLRHLFGQSLSTYGRPTNAHLSVFDPAGLVQLLSMAGFSLSEIRTSYVSIPLLSHLLDGLSPDSVIQDALCRIFRLVGQDIIVKATKGQTGFWEELDRHYEQRFT